MVCLWTSPAGLQVSPVECRRYHWKSQTSQYVSGSLQQVSRCLQQNPGGIIGCREPRSMSLEVSSRSPGVSSRIQEVSLDVANLIVHLWMSPAGLQGLQQNPGHIIGCRKPHGMPLDISSRSPRGSRGIQEGSLDVVNVNIPLVKAPASLQVSPAESRRYHWMSQTLWYVSGCHQQVSRCLQWNPGGIIGCREPRGMSLEVSSRSPGVSSRIQEVSLDVANLMVRRWMSPAGLQVSPAESRRDHWMSRTLWYVFGCLQVSPAESRRYHWMLRTSWYVSGCLQQVSRWLQQNPGCIIGCRKPHGMSLDVSSRSPGVSSRVQELSVDVVNIDVCLAKAPASLQVAPAESRRYRWMSRSSWYVSGCLQQVSSGLQWKPGGIIGCSECQQMSCEGSSKSLGVSSRIQEVSLDEPNLVVCLWTSPAGLQVPPAQSKRYHWMWRTLWYVSGCLQQVSRCVQHNPGGIIGCSERRHMSCEGSSESPADSRRYHWM